MGERVACPLGGRRGPVDAGARGCLRLRPRACNRSRGGARRLTACYANAAHGTTKSRRLSTLSAYDQEVLADRPVANPSATHAAPAAAAGLRAHFALLRSSRRARSLRLGPLYARYFSGWEFGLDFARARFVRTAASAAGTGIWVVPGTSGVCIMDGWARSYSGGNGTCAALAGTRSPDAGGLRYSDRGAGRWNTYRGLVPDGNHTVTIVLAWGGSRIVPVTDNVFSLRIIGRARALLVRDARGSMRRFRLRINENLF
jgi:hypothetical protein